MLAFRRTHTALVKGAHDKVVAHGSVLQFTRSHEDEVIFCAFNLSDTPVSHDLPEGNWLNIGSELGSIAPGPDGKLHLGPWQVALALKA